MNETIVLNECIVLSIEENFIILKNNKAEGIFKEIKDKVVNYAYNYFNKRRTKISLEEFYCNPYKEGMYFKLNYMDGISIGMVINCNIGLNGIINNCKSVIPNLSLISYSVHKEGYVFVDSDSDIEDIKTII